jgi:alpha-amylase
MPAVCLYFQVHQPFRVKKYPLFSVGRDHHYFNEEGATSRSNRHILERVSRKCYLPANRLMFELIERHPGFRISYSFSGVLLEQLEHYVPEALDSFRRLVKTGRVEVLGETYHHSLSFLYSKEEFRRQVALHGAAVRRIFGVKPRVFRNTELIYSDAVAAEAEAMGFAGILAEGADHLLGWRSPNFVYRPAGARKIALLLKNYRLSDDVAFRFSTRDWNDWPLTAEKFAAWINAINGNGTNVDLFMDYETFGEHQWEDTGIFDFLRRLPDEVLRHRDNAFMTPSEVIKAFKPLGEVAAPHYVSWADIERDLSAWRGNPLQDEALRSVYDMEKAVRDAGDPVLTDDWGKLQTSDHFYYMCTKWFADGDVHAYFNPYESPYEAFINYMNALEDLRGRVAARAARRPLSAVLRERR